MGLDYLKFMVFAIMCKIVKNIIVFPTIENFGTAMNEVVSAFY